MIKKISQIRDFGVFQDFEWNGLPDLKHLNVIYGWNYSGKTTLARILHTFNSKANPGDLANGYCELEWSQGNCSSNGYSNSPSIYVFDLNFIKANISFDETAAQPLLVLSERDKDTEEKISNCKEKLQGIALQIKLIEGQRNALLSSLEQAATTAASNIKNTLGLPNFFRPNLEQHVPLVNKSPTSFVLSETAYDTAFATYKNLENKEVLEPISTSNIGIEGLLNTTNSLIIQAVESVTLTRISEIPSVQSWVNEGRELHVDVVNCHFCGQPLPDELLESLAKHFSEAYQELIQNLKDIERKITAHITMEPSIPAKAFFFNDLQVLYDQLKTQILELFKAQAEALAPLYEVVSLKLNDPFKILNAIEVGDFTTEIVASIVELNAIITQHNLRAADVEVHRQKALLDLILHYVAIYVIDNKYQKVTDDAADLNLKINEHRALEKELLAELARLEAIDSPVEKAVGQLNVLLKSYFDGYRIYLQASSPRNWIIVRNGEVATSLSEGEKTGIAFCYFLIFLGNPAIKLSESTVVFDDPISSLDANHLYHVYSMIKDFSSDCKQTIVLTHNFEFLQLILDWFNGVNKLHSGQGLDGVPSWSALYVERLEESRSVLIRMPPQMLFQKSDYYYLFMKIHNLAKSRIIQAEESNQIANTIRRFIEAYLKLFTTYGGKLSERIAQLIDDGVDAGRVSKFVDEKSHLQKLHVISGSSSDPESKAVARIVLDTIEKKNPAHFETLMATL